MWLQKEIEKRGWKQADLARAAQLDSAVISNLINERRKPGEESCTAIAHALQIPAEQVFRAAGILPKSNPRDERIERLLNRIEQLSDTDQRFVDALIETLLNQQQREENNAPSPGPLAAPKQP